MPANTPPRAPAQISAEAEAWLAEGAFVDDKDLDAVPMETLRAETLEAYRPAAEQAVRDNRVTVSDSEINGIRVMIIDPPEPRQDRVLLYLFGGGFTLGSPFEDLPISTALAAKTGAKVIAPYYRLAPEHPYPAALDDIAKVAAQVFDGDTNACLAGESAGASLALALMHRLRANAQPLPQAAALLSPAADMGEPGDSHLAARDPVLLPLRVDQVVDAYVPGQDLTNPEISPIYGGFDEEFPPCFVTTGTRDLLLSSSVRLARVMREAGASIDMRVWEGMWHVFEFYPDIPEADASLTEIAAFLNTHF